jgi:hypothetical protein
MRPTALARDSEPSQTGSAARVKRTVKLNGCAANHVQNADLDSICCDADDTVTGVQADMHMPWIEDERYRSDASYRFDAFAELPGARVRVSMDCT